MLTQTVLQHHLFCSIIKQKSGYSVCQRLSWLCVMQITIIMTIGTNQRLIVKYRFQYFCIATAEKGSATSDSSGEIYFMFVFPCGLLLQGNHSLCQRRGWSFPVFEFFLPYRLKQLFRRQLLPDQSCNQYKHCSSDHIMH